MNQTNEMNEMDEMNIFCSFHSFGSICSCHSFWSDSFCSVGSVGSVGSFVRSFYLVNLVQFIHFAQAVQEKCGARLQKSQHIKKYCFGCKNSFTFFSSELTADGTETQQSRIVRFQFRRNQFLHGNRKLIITNCPKKPMN